MKPEVMIVLAAAFITLFALPIMMPASTHPDGFKMQGWLNIHPALAAEQSSDTKSFTLLVSALGFNGTKHITLTVNESDLVKITLVYDDEVLGDNPHLIKVEGYGVEAWVSLKQRTNTLTFRALQSGSFKIHCANQECEGHDSLQDLVLQVRTTRPSETNGVGDEERPQERGTLIETHLTLQTSFPDVIRPGYNLTLTSMLRNGQREPVIGMPVTFYVNTTWGNMKIGTAYTNESGIAALEYRPLVSSSLEFESAFPGGAGFQASASNRVVKHLPSLTAEASPSSFWTVRNTAVTLVGLVVASVWGTYAYVFSRIRGIGKLGKSESHRSEDGGDP